jgi:hypothetical protein
MVDWGEAKPNGEFWMLNGGLKTILDFGFWVNFRQEDRICRKGVKKKLKPETGDRKGSGGLMVTGGADFGLGSIFVFRAHKVGELLLCRQLSSEFSW